MELYTKLPTKRLSQTIDRLTDLARDKYGVDMGDLFYVKFRDVNLGNYIELGASSTITKVSLTPNEEAFEAIDKSTAQDYAKIQRNMEEKRKQDEITREYQKIQNEGNFVLGEDGEISVPTNFPQINVQC